LIIILSKIQAAFISSFISALIAASCFTVDELSLSAEHWLWSLKNVLSSSKGAYGIEELAQSITLASMITVRAGGLSFYSKLSLHDASKQRARHALWPSKANSDKIVTINLLFRTSETN
jgi:hypothetical protein